jgi:hypothetical protein
LLEGLDCALVKENRKVILFAGRREGMNMRTALVLVLLVSALAARIILVGFALAELLGPAFYFQAADVETLSVALLLGAFLLLVLIAFHTVYAISDEGILVRVSLIDLALILLSSTFLFASSLVLALILVVWNAVWQLTVVLVWIGAFETNPGRTRMSIGFAIFAAVVVLFDLASLTGNILANDLFPSLALGIIGGIAGVLSILGAAE